MLVRNRSRRRGEEYSGNARASPVLFRRPVKKFPARTEVSREARDTAGEGARAPPKRKIARRRTTSGSCPLPAEFARNGPIPMKTLTILSAALLFSLALPASLEAQITVRSPAFASGGNIPAQFTCKGANTNPPLQFQGIPKEAKSLALIVDDPDAPGGLFTHWVIWNIDPATTQIAEKSLARGAVEGANDFGHRGYGGPCPPSGTHRYFFRLFALDRTLDVKAGAKRSALEHAMKDHTVGQGELMGRFSH